MKGLLSQQRELLDAIKRYFTMDAYSALRALGLTDQITHRAMTRRMINLDKRNFIVQYKETPFGRVSRLGPRARSIYPELSKNSRAFQQPRADALARDIAVCRFVFASGSRCYRLRLTKAELESRFGELPIPLQNHPYVFDAQDKCLIRAYFPGGRSPATVAKILERDVYHFETSPALSKLIRVNRLKIAVLTFDQARTSQIQGHLHRSPRIPLSVHTLRINPRTQKKDPPQ